LLILEMQSKGASRFLFNPKPTRCFGVQVSHRVAQLAGDIAAARGGGGEKPDPLEVESFLEELLLLCQRSEEYNAFMLDKMRAGAGAGGGGALAMPHCVFQVPIFEPH
jgi:hypothetical protein